ncbi:hypothetical protein Sjap_000945 [Stephania japonica]|uniref:Senescence regulator n=1 Tax=Stephania japonica TaxID=461633 RepID=A0AAP0KLK9_9MAGN
MAKPSYQYHHHHQHHHHHHHHRSYNSVTNPEAIFEFDEADLRNSSSSSSNNNNNNNNSYSSSAQELKKSAKKRSNRVSIKQRSFQIESHDESVRGAATSLPVNIPDWSRMPRRDDDDDGESGAGGSMIPPHEFLARQFARTGIASFSVHEGIGRTLKGRDLSRVRDVILKKTGFED